MRWPQKFGPFRWLSGKAIIAPFWARVDEDLAFKNGNSKVYYQAYEQSSQGHPQKEMILSLASQDVQRYTTEETFKNFTATWVLVVTWVKLCPYVSCTELLCPWVSL